MRAFAFFDDELRGSEAYLAGANVGLWDLDLGAAYAYAKFRMKNSVEGRFSALEAYLTRLMTRSSFQKTVPPA